MYYCHFDNSRFIVVTKNQYTDEKEMHVTYKKEGHRTISSAIEIFNYCIKYYLKDNSYCS